MGQDSLQDFSTAASSSVLSVSQAGQAPSRLVSQKGQLPPEGCAECFSQTEAYRPSSKEPGGFWRKDNLFEVLGAQRRLCWAEGPGSRDVAAMSDCRYYDPRRPAGCSRTHGADHGDYRADCARWKKMGGRLDAVTSRRSSPAGVQFSANFDKPSTSSFWASLPTGMGDHCSVVCQGDRHHQQSETGGHPVSRNNSEGSTADSRQPKEKAAQVSKETKARRGSSFLNDLLEKEDVSPSGLHDMHYVSSTTPCSGDSLCRGQRVEEPDHGTDWTEDSAPFRSSTAIAWERLQNYSFHTWSSSLCSMVLKSRTAFARFLRTTLHAERRLDSSSKALFPLPIPKLGIFEAKKLGSKARRRRAFDQAFHICVMALNYQHSDFSPIPVESLCRAPSSAQRIALENLRKMLKAFGSSGENFQVPQSGRRMTTLAFRFCYMGGSWRWWSLFPCFPRCRRRCCWERSPSQYDKG